MLVDYSKAINETILKAVERGDDRAFGELYKRYQDEIFRYIYYRVANNRFEAEDLTQEVFIRAWNGVKENKPVKRNFRALVYRIAYNITVDRWRTRKQELPIEEDTKLLSSRASTPEQIFLVKEEGQELAAAIRKLKPQEQNVFICRFINELSHKETAQSLGLTEGHVRVLQYRALKKIQVLTK